tara:strand:- start:17126 stop:18331 length:1206 start_codon:yes stop_codon:yes gene_type:complete
MSIVDQSMTQIPAYMEDYIKDMFANIYNVQKDAEGNPILDADGNPIVTGLASKSPLEGTPIFETDAEGNEILDAEGNPIPVYELDEEGNQVLDQYGQPVQKFEGGVPKADIIRFTDPQIKALEMFAGQYDDEGNYIEGTGGIGAYQDYYDKATKYLEQAAGALDPTAMTAMYDEQGNPIYETDEQGNPIIGADGKPVQKMQSYMEKWRDPYLEDVVDTTLAEIQREGDIEGIGARNMALASGAYGGSRQAVTEQELQRNISALKASKGAELRSGAFDKAMGYGQKAAQLFGNLATQTAGLGDSSQAALLKDVNSLFNVGALEQAQLQSEYDVERASALEEAYEPFGRIGFMRDMLSGVPSGQTSYSTQYAPNVNPVGNMLTMAQAGGNAAGTGIYSLGAKK